MAAGGDAEDLEPDAAASGTVPTAEPAPEVLLPLLPFQKEWLAWALAQEASASRGGILGDEMGMGKTIQAISLVLTARQLRPPSQQASSSSSSSPATPKVGCTLVVCPVVAAIQWAEEIERRTAQGSARVLVYHGPRRRDDQIDFHSYDFVITTYHTIELDYRKNIISPKIPCPYCDKLIHPRWMNMHWLDICGPGRAVQTGKQAKQQRKKLGSSKVKGKRRGHKKADGGEKGDCEELGDELHSQSRDQSPLHLVRWERVILDEAQCIKDRRSNTAKAVFALESEYKWALSGTPLLNNVEEFYSLIRFLQIYPYSNYFCEDCACETLDTPMKKDCDCGHSSVRHFCWWKKYILKPLDYGLATYEGQEAMILLKEKVMKGILLRRTKIDRAADLAMPPIIVTVRLDSFDKNEMKLYDALYAQSCTKFDSYVASLSVMSHFAHIFDLLTKLQQAVNHPYLVAYFKTAKPGEGSTNEGIESQCGICHDIAEDVVVTSCDHAFCKTCLMDYFSTLGNVSCPSCSQPLTVDLTTNSGEMVTRNAKGRKRSGILNRLASLAGFKSSTKIDALREEVRNMIEHDGSAKGIVFSQFTSFLNLIQFFLEKSGIKCVQLNGAMNITEKRRAIDNFTNDPDYKIFLMSLKAGGVALNLTVASHVFLMDPWSNPAVESQARDRIYRMGQFKPIRATRFVIKDTVEERILQLQEKKRLVFEGFHDYRSRRDRWKLREDELKFIFQK